MDGGGGQKFGGRGAAAPQFGSQHDPHSGGHTVGDLWGAVMDGGGRVRCGGGHKFGVGAAAPDLDPHAARGGGGGEAISDLWGAMMEGGGV